jgi:hypothetical protein
MHTSKSTCISISKFGFVRQFGLPIVFHCFLCNPHMTAGRDGTQMWGYPTPQSTYCYICKWPICYFRWSVHREVSNETPPLISFWPYHEKGQVLPAAGPLAVWHSQAALTEAKWGHHYLPPVQTLAWTFHHCHLFLTVKSWNFLEGIPSMSSTNIFTSPAEATLHE